LRRRESTSANSSMAGGAFASTTPSSPASTRRGRRTNSVPESGNLVPPHHALFAKPCAPSRRHQRSVRSVRNSDDLLLVPTTSGRSSRNSQRPRSRSACEPSDRRPGDPPPGPLPLPADTCVAATSLRSAMPHGIVPDGTLRASLVAATARRKLLALSSRNGLLVDRTPATAGPQPRTLSLGR